MSLIIYFIAFIVFCSLFISKELPSIVLGIGFSPACHDLPCYCNIKVYLTSEDEAEILLIQSMMTGLLSHTENVFLSIAAVYNDSI